MLTFSLNTVSTKEQIKNTAKLIKSVTPQNQRYLTDAYFRIINKPGVALIDLTAFSYLKKRDEQAQRQEVSLEGLVEEPSYESFEDLAIARADEKYYQETFIELRADLFINHGVDLWRLLELVVKYNDALASKKLRQIVKEKGIENYFREFCSNWNNLLNVSRVLG